MAKKEEIELVITPDGKLKARVKTKHSHLGSGMHPDLKKFGEAIGGIESQQLPLDSGQSSLEAHHGHGHG